jgi:DNA (cytosine-5)-methyltransferase 1
MQRQKKETDKRIENHLHQPGIEALEMRVLDLFSGVGMFSYGLSKVLDVDGKPYFETVAFCEIEPWPRRVLAKHWPDVPIYSDVRELTSERLEKDGVLANADKKRLSDPPNKHEKARPKNRASERSRAAGDSKARPEKKARKKSKSIDVITGGFPCQDLSVAGNQAGITGDRSSLFHEIIRLTRELGPRYVVLENVAALLTGDSGGWMRIVLGAFAKIGFDAEWHVISAKSAGAPHLRERVWIVADTSGEGLQGRTTGRVLQGRGTSDRYSRQGSTQPGGRESERPTEPCLGLRSDGASNGLLGTGGRLDGETAQTRPSEVLQDVPPEDGSGTHQWPIGGYGGILAPSILQSLLHGSGLCQVCAAKTSLSPRGPEVAWEIVRELWGRETPCSPSRRRELEEQLSREHPDIMRFLSRHTPSPCRSCWSDGSWENGTPRVAIGVPDRVNKLKALGNGLVWQIPYAIGRAVYEHNVTSKGSAT